MGQLCGLLLLSGSYPLYRAWRGLAGTTLRHALAWAALAWLAWCLAWLTGGGRELRYLGACLTGCAGISVLGARRPGLAAWDLVVAGLLALLCRPFFEGLGELRLDAAHLTFLVLVLAVGAGNYLPTRTGPAALLLLVCCAAELAGLAGALTVPEGAVPLGLALVPWLALAGRARGRPAGDPDAAWRAFRDSFGFLWGQRVREQFNRAAANAGLPVELGWGGLRPLGEGAAEGRARALELLEDLLRRFRTAEAGG
jgi:hypothetical protein